MRSTAVLDLLAAALLAATAALLALRSPVRRPPRGGAVQQGDDRALLGRLRGPLAALGFVAGWAFVGGAVGVLAGLLGAVLTWRVLSGVESPAVARRREQVRAELPVAVELIGASLAAGGAAVTAFGLVAEALPGPLGDELAAVHHRLELGVDPALVWGELQQHAELAPLGRALSRAHDSGAAVVAVVAALAEDLRERARAEVEERARSVDVRAAAPLGVCLLPAFLLLGVVPMVAGLFTTMALFG
ncbi:MAG: type II secretion system F family protein [Marmoricola sp.]